MLNQQLNCVCNTLAKQSVTSAINNSYHDRQSQLLPKEDVALVIWGNKITGKISPHLRFHMSKEVARKYLSSRPKDKWSNECFDMVDWEHLDLALKNKADMYKVWRSKQIFGLFVVQGFRSAAPPANSSPTRDAQIAEDRRRPPISCFAPTMNAPDYWLRTLMN
jgi:hypothetical protein